MPLLASTCSLRCRACEASTRSSRSASARAASARSSRLRPRASRTSLTREAIEAGPRRSGAMRRSCPSRPAEQRLAPGLTPLVTAPRLAEALGVGELYLKLDTANPTHSFKDRVVAVACAKALEHGLDDARLLLDRQPRERRRSASGRGGHRGGSALPGRPRAREADGDAVYGATIYAVDGSYDDCSRLSVELSFELDWAFVNVSLRSYYAEGSKTLGFEIAEQLGWELPTRSSGRSPRARCSRRCTRVSPSCARSASSTGRLRG